jgi:hypothetical protein
MAYVLGINAGDETMTTERQQPLPTGEQIHAAAASHFQLPAEIVDEPEFQLIMAAVLPAIGAAKVVHRGGYRDVMFALIHDVTEQFAPIAADPRLENWGLFGHSDFRSGGMHCWVAEHLSPAVRAALGYLSQFNEEPRLKGDTGYFACLWAEEHGNTKTGRWWLAFQFYPRPVTRPEMAVPPVPFDPSAVPDALDAAATQPQ